MAIQKYLEDDVQQQSYDVRILTNPVDKLQLAISRRIGRKALTV